jgi:hypothetical protein
MVLPLYSGYRGGFDTSVLELCTDYVTITIPSTTQQADDGGQFYGNPLAYAQLGTTGVANPFASTPSKDPFFAQPDDTTSDIALFRCQFITYQREVKGAEGSGLIIAGKYVLPAAPWINYASFMNQYAWFYRRGNVDFQNPKGFEKINVTSIAPRHDLNRLLSHYELEVAR